MTDPKPTTKRTPAHSKADKAYIEREKAKGNRARKFTLNDEQADCLRAVETFVKKDEKNIKKVLDFISVTDNN